MNKKKALNEILFDINKIEEIIFENSTEKKYIISGKFTEVNKPNSNHRIYPKEIMQEAINRLRLKVEKGKIMMCVDHPDFFSSARLRTTGAILKEVTDVQPDGFAYYKAQIVDTTDGKNLKVLLDAGASIGVSTRGYGRSYEGEFPGFEGKYEIIDKGFELKSIDFVDDPSVQATQDDIRLESTNSEKEQNVMTLEELKTNHPELFKQIEDEKVSQ